jgi:hypothetical protein
VYARRRIPLQRRRKEQWEVDFNSPIGIFRYPDMLGAGVEAPPVNGIRAERVLPSKKGNGVERI